MRAATSAEVGKTEVVNLLRDNSLTVMLVMAFAQVEGADFIRGTLYQPLQEIMKDASPLELNPQSESDPAALAANVQRLEKYCALILDACEASKPLIPPSFKRICSFVRQEIEKALPEEADGTELRTSTKVLSSFFFLRYIIPAVANPEKYALADEVTPGTEPPYRQALKFIAKACQQSLLSLLALLSFWWPPFSDADARSGRSSQISPMALSMARRSSI